MQEDIAQKDSERKRGRKTFDQKITPSDPTWEFFPQGRHLPPGRIAVPDQKLKLMGHQHL